IPPSARRKSQRGIRRSTAPGSESNNHRVAWASRFMASAIIATEAEPLRSQARFMPRNHLTSLAFPDRPQTSSAKSCQDPKLEEIPLTHSKRTENKFKILAGLPHRKCYSEYIERKTKAQAKSPRLFSFPTMSRTSSSRRRPSASRSKPVRKKPVRKKPARKKPVPEKPVPQTPRQRELTTKRRGELAELAFVLKAANLGFGVARPYGDSERYDVILDARNLDARDLISRRHRSDAHVGTAAPGCPAARKYRAAAAPQKHRPGQIRHCPPDPSPPLWRVQVKCSTQISTGLYRVNAHRRSNGRAVPYLPGEIHFFAAYIIPEDTWYILPLHALRGVTSLLFRRRRDRRPGLYDAYREAWHLLRPK